MALIAGFCINGPYRYDLLNLLNPNCGFLSFGYQKRYVEPTTLKRIKEGIIRNDDRVYVAMWDADKSEKGVMIREGTIDFLRVYPDFVRFNIFLDPPNRRTKFELIVFDLGKVDNYLLRER